MTTGSIDMSGTTAAEVTDAVGKNATGLQAGTDVTKILADNPPPPELLDSIRETGMGTRSTGRGGR
jgi:hypothetical protein